MLVALMPENTFLLQPQSDWEIQIKKSVCCLETLHFESDCHHQHQIVKKKIMIWQSRVKERKSFYLFRTSIRSNVSHSYKKQVTVSIRKFFRSLTLLLLGVILAFNVCLLLCYYLYCFLPVSNLSLPSGIYITWLCIFSLRIFVSHALPSKRINIIM